MCGTPHPGGRGAAKQEPWGRRACTGTREAVNPVLEATTQAREEMPQKVTFLPVAQPGLRAVPARMGLCKQPEGFAPGITFPSPDLWWETHRAGV